MNDKMKYFLRSLNIKDIDSTCTTCINKDCRIYKSMLNLMPCFNKMLNNNVMTKLNINTIIANNCKHYEYMYKWIDKEIEKQKHNINIMNKISSPLSPSELQEIAEKKGF